MYIFIHNDRGDSFIYIKDHMIIIISEVLKDIPFFGDVGAHEFGFGYKVWEHIFNFDIKICTVFFFPSSLFSPNDSQKCLVVVTQSAIVVEEGRQYILGLLEWGLLCIG